MSGCPAAQLPAGPHPVEVVTAICSTACTALP